MKPIPPEINERLLDPAPLSEQEIWSILKAAGSYRVFRQWAHAIATAAQAFIDEAEALEALALEAEALEAEPLKDGIGDAA